MEEWEIEFLKAVEMLEVKASEPLEYRLHYNEDGDIYMCTMIQHPENTQFVVVTKEQYDRYFDYHVVKGMLKLIDKSNSLHVKLKSSTRGYATVKSHAGLILEPGEVAVTEYWSIND